MTPRPKRCSATRMAMAWRPQPADDTARKGTASRPQSTVWRISKVQIRLSRKLTDAEVHLDLSAAGRSDDLADTVDYGALTGSLARVVRQERHALLERLAHRLADECLADERVASATVEVTKLRPPVPEALEAASVR